MAEGTLSPKYTYIENIRLFNLSKRVQKFSLRHKLHFLVSGLKLLYWYLDKTYLKIVLFVGLNFAAMNDKNKQTTMINLTKFG